MGSFTNQLNTVGPLPRVVHQLRASDALPVKSVVCMHVCNWACVALFQTLGTFKGRKHAKIHLALNSSSTAEGRCRHRSIRGKARYDRPERRLCASLHHFNPSRHISSTAADRRVIFTAVEITGWCTSQDKGVDLPNGSWKELESWPLLVRGKMTVCTLDPSQHPGQNTPFQDMSTLGHSEISLQLFDGWP